MPNKSPEGGITGNFLKYKDLNHKLLSRCIIDTFGFGYQMDSQLLDQISQIGNGNYNFIPDSSFVGTIFVNSLSNMLSTKSFAAKL